MKTVAQLPAGRYFVGDPCYAISEDDWDTFCDILFGNPNDTVTEFKGVPMLAAGTAFGDGCYPDNQGRVYGVDAGLIGVVPEALWGKYPEDKLNRLGYIATFNEPFRAYTDGEGYFEFGTIAINTGDDDEEDVDYSDV